MTLWFLARAAGMVALMAFTITVVLGALASDAPLRGRTVAELDRALDRRMLRQLLHRTSAFIALATLGLHLVLILLDTYVSVSVAGMLVPFTAGYRALALGLGTIGVYVLILAAVVGVLRGRLAVSPRSASWWRWIHGAAYGGWLLALGHGVLAGTDTGSWWSTACYVGSAAAVAAAVWVRLGRADRRTEEPLPAARRLVRTGGSR